jgi:hypothetical protein
MRKPVQYLLTFERTETKDNKTLTHKTFVTQTTYDGKPPVCPSAAKIERKRYRKLKAHVEPWAPTDEWRKQQAITYVRWLAARDGIKLPKRGEIRVEWSSVDSKTRTHTHRRWDGSLLKYPIQERRIRAVSWGHEEERFNKRKDGRQGAWMHNEFVAEVTIDIPNWDFEPDPPVEEIVDDDEARKAA